MPTIEVTASEPSLTPPSIGDVRVGVDDAGDERAAGRVDHLGAARASATSAPTARILPSRTTTVPFSMRLAAHGVDGRVGDREGVEPGHRALVDGHRRRELVEADLLGAVLARRISRLGQRRALAADVHRHRAGAQGAAGALALDLQRVRGLHAAPAHLARHLEAQEIAAHAALLDGRLAALAGDLPGDLAVLRHLELAPSSHGCRPGSRPSPPRCRRRRRQAAPPARRCGAPRTCGRRRRPSGSRRPRPRAPRWRRPGWRSSPSRSCRGDPPPRRSRPGRWSAPRAPPRR